MKNKKGFTLIELIALIVILGVLMLLVIPAVSRYIEEANKKSYLATIDSIVDTVRYGVNSGDSNYSMDGVNEKKFKLKDIEKEKGKKSNIYGYVKVVKKSIGEYEYKVFSSGSSNNSSYCIDEIDYNNLTINNLNKCIGADYDYIIGDVITYKNSNWYVIKNSTSSENYVTLLKETVLAGTEIGANYVDEGNTSKNTMAYYWSNKCHSKTTYGTDTYVSLDSSGCENEYKNSKIKKVLDNYMTSNNMTYDLKLVNSYRIRLITYDELINNLGFIFDTNKSNVPFNTNKTPSWVYSTSYWTMTPSTSQAGFTWYVSSSGYIITTIVRTNPGVRVRPVINLLKSAIN